MKLKTTVEDWYNLPRHNQYFLDRFKALKGYPVTKEWTRDQIDEVLIAIATHEFRTDTALERSRNDDESTYFDNIVDYGEYMIAWDGREPIDIAFHKLNEKLKRRIIQYLTIHPVDL